MNFRFDYKYECYLVLHSLTDQTNDGCVPIIFDAPARSFLKADNETFSESNICESRMICFVVSFYLAKNMFFNCHQESESETLLFNQNGL